MTSRYIPVWTILLTFSVLFIYALRYSFDLSIFLATPDHIAENITNFPNWIKTFGNKGHDGAYIWAMAKDPLNPSLIETQHHFERWLFPFLMNIFALGKEEYLILSGLLINLFSTGLIAYFSGLILLHFRKNHWWAILIALGPGFAMPLRFNLINQFFLLLCVSQYFCLYKNKKGWFYFLSSLNLINLPISIGVHLGGTFYYLFHKKDKASIGYFLLSFIPFIFLKVYFIKFLGLEISFLTNDILGNGSNDVLSIPLVKPLWDVKNTFMEVGLLKFLLFLFTLTFYSLIFYSSILEIIKKRRISFENFIIGGFSIAALSMDAEMISGGTMQVARFTPIFPLLLINHLGQKSLLSRTIISLTIISSILGIVWFLFGPKI